MPHQTPFHGFCTRHGATMAEYAGWELPAHFVSPQDDHHQVRRAGGLFDLSHLTRLHLTGRDARRLLERLLSRRVSDLEPGQSRFALICNERGGVVDEVVVYRFDNYWMLVANAENRDAVNRCIGTLSDGLALSVDDQTAKTAMVSVQGPAVMDFIGRFSGEVPSLSYGRFCVKNLLILKLAITRRGYTGEDGVEVMLPSSAADMAVKLLLRDGADAPVRPVGMACRQTLRIEAGLPAYGHEITAERDALSAGLAGAVDLTKGDDDRSEPFPGLEALRRIADAGHAERRIQLAVEGRAAPEPGVAVTADGQPVGVVTSACLSPTLDKPIAIAVVKHDAPDEGLGVTVGGHPAGATPVVGPFVRRGG